MKAKKKQFKLTFKSVFLFAVLVLIGFTIFTYIKSNQDVNYNKLKSVSTSDQKISIDVPDQMKEVQSGLSAIDYEHRLTDQNQSLISHIRLESQYFGADILQPSRQEITDQLKQKNGQYYEIFKNKTNTNPAAKELLFNQFTDYKLGSRSGLISDFTYKYDDEVVDGRLLILFGEDTIYFVISEATQKVWSDNLDIWPKVFESIRIN